MTSRVSTKPNVTILIGLMLILSACAVRPVSTPTSEAVLPTVTSTLPLPASPTPTVPPTATAQPIAPSATPTVLPSTPTATAIPTLETSVPTSHGDGPCTYRATFLGDITIPDNTQIARGASFVKTWRVRNDGNCTWGSGLTLHALDFVYGAQLGAPTEVPLAQNVPPGSTFDVSIEMIAPNDPGLYRSEWMFHIADGPLLGVGADRQTPLAAQIVVRMEDTPPEIWQSYTSTTGLFSIKYPATDAFYENEIPSVDGVLTPVSNTIAIRISAPDPLILSITFKPIEPNTSLAAFAAQDDACVAKSRGDPTQGEPLEISGQAALLFRDTPCGPNGSTVIYTTHGALGYRLAIPYVVPYEYVNGWVVPILDTFTMFGTTSTIQLPAS